MLRNTFKDVSNANRSATPKESRKITLIGNTTRTLVGNQH